jgi:hypothetical protein
MEGDISEGCCMIAPLQAIDSEKLAGTRSRERTQPEAIKELASMI